MPQTFRAVAVVRSAERGEQIPFDVAVLPHDQRRLRRRLVELAHDDGVLVDFREPTTLDSGDCLRLEDGRLVEIIAGEEPLYEVRARDDIHLMQLCWHLGNRHLKVQIEREWEGLGKRVLILRDHVIRDMLVGLGATVEEIFEPFSPIEGAYSHSHEPAHALLNR